MGKQKRRQRMIYSLLIILLIAQPMLICSYLYYKKNNGLEKYYYKESDEIIKNPYSGAYMQSGTNKDALKHLRTEFQKHPEISMVLFAYNLDDEWEMEQIPEEKLADLENSLSLAEELGFSVILRAAYDFQGEPRDPEFSIILTHIKQISEVVNRHKDCMAGVQAGMLGVYGEWHGSKYMDDVYYRLEVIRSWLKELDESIYISVRRPKFIREAKEQGMDIRRIGFYNDGLFSSDSDLGTYVGENDRTADLEWIRTNIRIPFNGGEMPYVTKYSRISNVVDEAKYLNLTYLNYWYNVDVWEQWRNDKYQGMDGDQYLLKYLGSRLYITEMKIQKNYELRENFDIEINLKNNGFAVVDPLMKAYAVIDYNGKRVEQELALEMDSKELGRIYGQIDNPFVEEIKNAQNEGNKNGIGIGIKISRNKTVADDFCIILANEQLSFDEGYNWVLSPY